MGLPDTPHYVGSRAAAPSSHISNAWHEVASASTTPPAIAGVVAAPTTTTTMSSLSDNVNVIHPKSPSSHVITPPPAQELAHDQCQPLPPPEFNNITQSQGNSVGSHYDHNVEAQNEAIKVDQIAHPVVDAVLRTDDILEEEQEEEEDDDDDDDDETENKPTHHVNVLDCGAGVTVANVMPPPVLPQAGDVVAANIDCDEMSNGEELGEKGGANSAVGGGPRWPRQEANDLLKIRADMDAAFQESNSPKAPLWEEISRKMAEMGYERSAKKCKEKFENMHKYYKRTREGKSGRPDGKNYRFFNQLEALYGKKSQNISYNNNNNSIKTSISSTDAVMISTAGVPTLMSVNDGSAIKAQHYLNIAASPVVINITADPTAFPATVPAIAALRPPIIPGPVINLQPAKKTLQNIHPPATSDHSSTSLDPSFQSSSSDEDGDTDNETSAGPTTMSTNPVGHHSIQKKKKRSKSMKRYLILFREAMNQVLEKQEEMQFKFLEALERTDKERMMREDAWKRQEMARLNMETEIRAQETAISASRDSTLIDLLHKISGQGLGATSYNVQLQPPPTSSYIPPMSTNIIHVDHQAHRPAPNIIPTYNQQLHQDVDSSFDNKDVTSSHENKDIASSPPAHDKDTYDLSNKRWPKPEVLVLIKIRTNLDRKFHEPGSKALLWEEISRRMLNHGYSRTAKRCKEKWENINKYFKKAKESNKKRPEDAKTCPYFHHLSALYKQGLLGGGNGGGGGVSSIDAKETGLDQADTHCKLPVNNQATEKVADGGLKQQPEDISSKEEAGNQGSQAGAVAPVLPPPAPTTNPTTTEAPINGKIND